MAIRTPRRHVSDAENKLRILYCVNALEHVTEIHLWPFVASLELMEYIPMQLLLHELLSSGDLDMGHAALEGIVALSRQGRETLRLFEHRVMKSDRERIDDAAPAYRAHMEQKRQVQAIYESARKEDYRVLLSLKDGELPVLKIRLGTPSLEHAATSLRVFEHRAAAVIGYFYGLNIRTLEMGTETDGFTPVVDSQSLYEHVLTETFVMEDVVFEVELLLPSLDSAMAFGRFFAVREHQEEISRRIFSLLCRD